jgi:hypothetical protein
MYCPSCGSDIVSGVTVCPSCKKALPEYMLNQKVNLPPARTRPALLKETPSSEARLESLTPESLEQHRGVKDRAPSEFFASGSSRENQKSAYSLPMDIKDSFRVMKNKKLGGYTEYALFLLEDRMVVAKIGKKGSFDFSDFSFSNSSNGLTGFVVDLIFGIVVVSCQSFWQLAFKNSGEKFLRLENRTSPYTKMPTGAILRLNKDNFELPYDDISSIKMEKRGLSKQGRFLRIEGKRNETFEIAGGQDPDHCWDKVLTMLPDQAK